MDTQEEQKHGIKQKASGFLKNVMRVLRVASKPSGSEYKDTLKITGIGLLLAGAVGFVIYVLFQLIGIF